MKNSKVEFEIETDDNQVPESIKWKAGDDGQGQARALMISIWDANEQNTLRIDLWDKELTKEDMKQFFHQTILTLTDSFEKATDEKRIADGVRMFCEDLKKQMNI